MAGNVAHAMVPAQRRRLAALRAGESPDEAEARRAGARALHNQYLALPVIFFMLAGHAPLLFAGPRRIGVAIAALGAGFVIRRFFLFRAQGAREQLGLGRGRRAPAAGHAGAGLAGRAREPAGGERATGAGAGDPSESGGGAEPDRREMRLLPCRRAALARPRPGAGRARLQRFRDWWKKTRRRFSAPPS